MLYRHLEMLERFDRYNLMRWTWPMFSAPGKSFEESMGDSPEDRLRLCLARACVWLYRIQGRNGYEWAADLGDVKRAT